MRYFAICIVLLFCSMNSIFAQQSVGFSNPDNLKPLLDYRLPDWGYSNFYLDFNARGSGSDLETSTAESGSRRGEFRVGPAYRLFRESEKRIVRFNAWLDSRYSGQTQTATSNFSNAESEDQSRKFLLDFNILTSIREYVTSGSFLFGEGNIALDYRSTKRKNFDDGTLNNKVVSYNRQFSVTPRIGYGIGRIRNVNPIIRAIRLKERASALGSRLDFSNQDILDAADQFTRYDGYQQTYDRPAKYFWGDMNEAISPNLGSLNTFDMLYLTDVLDEAIGTRLEGWEVIGGAEFDYQNDLERVEEIAMLNRTEFINKRVGVFVDGRWYKNISLTQQWGITGNATLSYPLREEQENIIEQKRSLMLQASVNYLWNVTDRFLLQSELSNIYSRSKFEGFSIGGGEDYSRWTNRLLLANNFSYFLENRLSLTLSLDSILIHTGDTLNDDVILEARRFNWSAGLGLRYYFSRNLY